MDRPDLGQVLVGENRLGDLQALVGASLPAEQVRPGPDHRHQAHDQFLADRVDGRVRHLGEVLLEIVVEQLGALRQDRDREVRSHRTDGIIAAPGHGLQEMGQVLLRVAEGLLAIEQADRVGRRRGLYRRDLGKVLELELGAGQPLLVGFRLGEGALDLLVLDDPTLLQVDEEHLPGLQAPLADDPLVRDRQDADLGRHDDVVLVGDHETRWAQAIAVEGGADLAAVREGHGGGSVPRLHERRVVLVEGPALGVHQRVAGPGLRDQHHHRLGQRNAAGDEELQGVVEAGGVRLAVRDQRPHLVEVRAQEIALQRAPAGVHPVHIAPDRVDLAVVGDEPVRVGELPGREGVGREPLVHQGQGRDRPRVAQVTIEAANLVGEQEALVDHRPGREGGQVELGQVGQVLLHRQLGQRVLQLLADGQQLALEGVLVPDVRAHADDGLPDHRHLGQDGLAKAVGVHRHVAPAQQDLALDLQEVLELLDGDVARRLVLGQEAHGHGVAPGLGQVDAGLPGPVAQQGVRNLDQNAGAIAHEGVSADGAAMVEINQDLQAAGHDVMRFAPLDVGDKPHPTRVMLVARIVQTLLFRSPHGEPHSNRFKAHANAAARAVFTRITGSHYRLHEALSTSARPSG